MRRWLAPAVVAVAVMSTPVTSASAETASLDYGCRIAGKGGIILTAGTDDAVVAVDLRAPSKVTEGDRVSFAGVMSVALGERFRRSLRLTANTLRLQADDVRTSVTSGKEIRQVPATWKSGESSTASAPLTFTGPIDVPAGDLAQAGQLTVSFPEVLELEATGSGLLGSTRFSLTCTAADENTTVASLAVAAKTVAAPKIGPPAALPVGPSSVLAAPASDPVAQEVTQAAPTVALSLSESHAPRATRGDITTAAVVLVGLALAYAAWCELRLRGFRSRLRQAG